MSESIISRTAAHKTTRMIGQEKAMAQVEAAISAPGDAFRIVFIRAQGGMGKTRLLKEIVAKHKSKNSNSLVESNRSNIIISDLVDLIDVRLHGREKFIESLRDSLRRPLGQGADFLRYDRAFNDLRVKRASGAQYDRLAEAFHRANEAFLNDLKEITQTQRLAWVLDTVEQLSFVTSAWLMSHKLLKPEDLSGRTYQWLIELLQNEGLKNITLLLAGRGQEGTFFFDEVASATKEAKANDPNRVELIDVTLAPFDKEETRQYFEVLASDLAITAATKRGEEAIKAKRLARQLEEVANPKNDRHRVLWLYTGGIPVRLALYAQLIVEGRIIPEPLRQTFAQAVEAAGTDDPVQATNELRVLQWQIEDEFITLLFHQTDLRAEILQMLVRAPRGLTAEQIHFALDSREDQEAEQWRADPDKLNRITKTLQNMSDYYLVKRRASWFDFFSMLSGTTHSPDKDELSITLRIGLQDEIYRIYAEHMAPHSDPVLDEIQIIWESLDEETRHRYKSNREFEHQERYYLYQKLYDWADYQFKRYRTIKQAYLAEDERRLERQLVLDDPRTFRFQELSSVELDRRAAINEALRTFEVERSVYDLLQDPERNYNNSDLASEKSHAGKPEDDFWLQTEVWRIVFDDYLLKFINFYPRPETVARGETPVDTLRRAAIQEDISRWIKRLTLAGKYKRAIALAQVVEDVLQKMPNETPEEQAEWNGWHHSLARTERHIWAGYAHILAAKESKSTLDDIRAYITDLIKLHNHSVEEVAIVRSDGYEEKGFAGVPDKNIPAHPAFDRLRRLISHAYNIVGYGLVMLGKMRLAVQAYGQSLYYIRDDADLMQSHRAVVLNNLSRALSELGYPGTVVCLDGLRIRRELTEEVPLAYSYNTLALIYDGIGRSEDAPMLSAKAIAYFRRAEFPRGLGLALLQLGESLRHLDKRALTGESVLTPPDNLYSTADILLSEAYQIFTQIIPEPTRAIQVGIELGSLYRDRLHLKDQNEIQRYQHEREALAYLTQAQRLAYDSGLLHYEVDAEVNLAWTYFYAGREKETEQMIAHVINRIAAERGPELLIDLDKPQAVNTGPGWVYLQMSKLQMCQAWLAAKRFNDIVNRLSSEYRKNRDKRHWAVHENLEAQKYLANLAENYMLGLAYAHLFSPRGGMIDFLLDDFYNQIKGFNQMELDDLEQHVLKLYKSYPYLKQTVDMLHQFLHNFFGLPARA